MSDIVYITSLVKIDNQQDIINAPEWVRKVITPINGGFNLVNGYAGHSQYAYGNWICLLSNGSHLAQSDEQTQAMALSMRAFVAAGLVQGADRPSGFLGRILEAFECEEVLTFIQIQSEPEDDVAEVAVMGRVRAVDELTGTIDHRNTWVMISSEYASGHLVDAVRLSALIEALVKYDLAYVITARGIETA